MVFIGGFIIFNGVFLLDLWGRWGEVKIGLEFRFLFEGMKGLVVLLSFDVWIKLFSWVGLERYINLGWLEIILLMLLLDVLIVDVYLISFFFLSFSVGLVLILDNVFFCLEGYFRFIKLLISMIFFVIGIMLYILEVVGFEEYFSIFSWLLERVWFLKSLYFWIYFFFIVILLMWSGVIINYMRNLM